MRSVQYCSVFEILNFRGVLNLSNRNPESPGLPASFGADNAKKEEFPGIMDHMLTGNSLPQICVVSESESVGNRYF